MDLTKKLDLSIPRTQNTIAVTLARYFTLEEVLQIDMGIVDCAQEHQMKPCHGMEYDIVFDGTNNSFKIACLLDTDITPPDYYLLLSLNKGNYHTEIKCDAVSMNPRYVGLIAAKTSNFIQYRNSDDVFYNKKSIINNISKCIANIINDVKALIQLRPWMTNIYDIKAYEPVGFNDEIIIDDKYKVSISTSLIGVIKIDYANLETGVSKFAHLPNTEMGMNMVILTIDKATIRVAEKIYLDNGDETVELTL